MVMQLIAPLKFNCPSIKGVIYIGLRGTCPPPPGQNFFIFMQFSGKISQKVCWCPPLGLAPPPLGNPGSATAFWLNFMQKTEVILNQTRNSLYEKVCGKNILKYTVRLLQILTVLHQMYVRDEVGETNLIKFPFLKVVFHWWIAFLRKNLGWS